MGNLILPEIEQIFEKLRPQGVSTYYSSLQEQSRAAAGVGEIASALLSGNRHQNWMIS
jgi:hypothetical protein